MKGAMAVPLVNITNEPKKRRLKIMGNSQNFFLTLIKPQRSLRNSIK